jgi:hypothetical protein
LGQVGEEGLVVAEQLAGAVGQLGDRLVVGVGQLHDDVQRLQPHVVGEVGADAEAARRPVGEVAIEGERLLEVEAVGEDEPLGARIDAQLLVVGERLLAPDVRIAGIVAQAVEELGEVHVEVGEEGVHADDVGERRAEVAAVLLHPGFEGGALEVAQANAERLEGLQVLVRHRADRHQAEVAREQHVGGALEELRHLALERDQHLAVPLAEKRRRTPKSKNSNGVARFGSFSNSRSARSWRRGRARPSAIAALASKRRK